jgi:hypothetical protein
MTHTTSSHTTSSKRKRTSETPADFLRIMAKPNHYIFQTVPILDLSEAHSRLYQRRGEERERDPENTKMERGKHGNAPLRVWHARCPKKRL